MTATARPTLAAPTQAATRLHLGCGNCTPDGWVNIDKSPSVFLSRAPRLRRALVKAGIFTPEQGVGFPPGIVHADVSKRIPVPDSSVDYACSEHMIEHLARWQALNFLQECRRVLKPGGVLRLSTPDLEQMIRSYVDRSSPHLDRWPTSADAFCSEYAAFADLESTYARRIIRRLFSGAIHQWLYDYDSLTNLLTEAGFTEVERCTFREGVVPDLDHVEFRERSLFLEARA